MKNYLKNYRLLNNDTLLELFDLSASEIAGEIEGRIEKQIHDLTCWEGSDGTLLVCYEDGDGIIYPSTDKFLMQLEVGIRPATFFFAFCSSPDKFLALRGQHIQDLIETLSLDREKVDYTEESLVYIENIMHSKRFKTRQEVERLFLGILAYCGDSLCKAMHGDWYIDKDNGRQSSWQPYIKLADGRMIKPFDNLHESLLLYNEYFIPMIGLSPNEEVRPQKFNTYYSN